MKMRPTPSSPALLLAAHTTHTPAYLLRDPCAHWAGDMARVGEAGWGLGPGSGRGWVGPGVLSWDGGGGGGRDCCADAACTVCGGGGGGGLGGGGGCVWGGGGAIGCVPGTKLRAGGGGGDSGAGVCRAAPRVGVGQMCTALGVVGVGKGVGGSCRLE